MKMTAHVRGTETQFENILNAELLRIQGALGHIVVDIHYAVAAAYADEIPDFYSALIIYEDGE